jgi:hypothetical protein
MFYCASIVLEYYCEYNAKQLLERVPYLMGSGGTLLFDFMVRPIVTRRYLMDRLSANSFGSIVPIAFA